MTIKKIAICAAKIPFNYGGAEILVEELNRQFNLRGYSSEIIEVPFKWYPKTQLIDNAMVWRMIDLTESNGEKIDRVICTKYPTYAINHPNKVTWLFHQHRPIYDLLDTPYTDFDKNNIDDIKYIQQIKRIDDLMLKESKKIFTISQNVSERLRLFNGIESDVLYPPTKLDGKYKCNKSENYIFTAGRLDPLKRYELIIEAMQYVKSEIKLKIAGRGKHESVLKKLVKQLGLKEKVEFLGFVEDDQLINLYASSSLVYFAPKDEDYGFITIEAFKSKKPVITTIDSGGVLEFVEHDKNGKISKPDAKIIAENIDAMFKEQENISEYGTNGFNKVKDINWDEVINKLTMNY